MPFCDSKSFCHAIREQLNKGRDIIPFGTMYPYGGFVHISNAQSNYILKRLFPLDRLGEESWLNNGSHVFLNLYKGQTGALLDMVSALDGADRVTFEWYNHTIVPLSPYRMVEIGIYGQANGRRVFEMKVRFAERLHRVTR